MSALENIKNLIERVAGNVEAVIDDREVMLSEIDRLRKLLMERDKKAVKAMQDARIELEATRMDALRFKREWNRIETKLQNLNDRLTALAGTSMTNRQKRRGG